MAARSASCCARALPARAAARRSCGSGCGGAGGAHLSLSSSRSSACKPRRHLLPRVTPPLPRPPAPPPPPCCRRSPRLSPRIPSRPSLMRSPSPPQPIAATRRRRPGALALRGAHRLTRASVASGDPHRRLHRLLLLWRCRPRQHALLDYCPGLLLPLLLSRRYLDLTHDGEHGRPPHAPCCHTVSLYAHDFYTASRATHKALAR